ncbi:hypothetical protein AJ80_02420 [Polytolypa hystricis UAMH7299]|uniref:Protein ZIP4 homolog n=1 Tax=Polytolypa hystricis (strain UAMH7299) TaxID=1447883 RepID=A0A2B7YP91_POLH7|nr:hypothetical protein AJ80_02420 [Polytolypa hystricis UAMH7299]
MEPQQRRTVEKIKLILDFAAFLHSGLLNSINCDLSAVTARSDELNEHLDLILGISRVSTQSDRAHLDSLGTQLWNLGTRCMRDGKRSEDEGQFLCRGHDSMAYERRRVVRVFAFFMIECGAKRSKDVDMDSIRIFKVALKTAQGCLDVNLLDLGMTTLERAAIYEEKSSHRDSGLARDDIIPSKLSAEYHILRIVLALRQNRLDVVEHMYSTLAAKHSSLEPVTTERLADLLYEIGKNMLDRTEYSSAVTWLRRSYDALSQHDVSALSVDAGELRLCVIHGLIRALLTRQDDSAKDEISKLFSMLETDYGNRPPVLLLNLEIMEKQPDSDYRIYHEKLCTFLRTIILTEANFKLLIHYIHQLHKQSTDLAADALQQLLHQRLVLHGDNALLEKCFVTLIWIQTSHSDVVAGLDILSTASEKLKTSWRQSLSVEATYACLILLWKKVDHAFGLKDYTAAEKWCRLAQHPIFENAGDTNKSKLQRKLILCALEKNDTQAARRVFCELSDVCKSENLTRYLMYKVALLDEDVELAKECLEVLYKQDTEEATYILACVAESQHTGSRYQAAVVLQLLLDKLDSRPLDGIHMPALLRYCTARLLVEELSSNSEREAEIVAQLCNVFESASIQASQYLGRIETGPFIVPELEWFSKNSYNLAVQYCASWDPAPILRLLNTSIKLIDLYPSNLGSEATADLAIRRLLCDFLGAIISIAQARNSEDSQQQRDYYLDVRIHIQSFRGKVQVILDRRDGDEHSDLWTKYQTLLAFDFEAAVRLKQWQGLDKIIAESEQFADDKLYGIFADAMLCSDSPVEESVAVFQQIILHITRKDKPHNLTKLSRWIRCLFQLSLDSPTRVQIAETVLDQAHSLIVNSQTQDLQHAERQQQQQPVSSSCHYPEEELEWLCTTAFNRAVDFYLAADDTASKRWGQKVLGMAGLMRDHGVLYRVLREKFHCLKWDD